MYQAGKGSGANRKTKPRAHPDTGATGWCYIVGAVCLCKHRMLVTIQTSISVEIKCLLLYLPQVLIYADDFKSERADRERAQGQIQDLKDQIHQMKQQLQKQVRSSVRWMHLLTPSLPPPERLCNSLVGLAVLKQTKNYQTM